MRHIFARLLALTLTLALVTLGVAAPVFAEEVVTLNYVSWMTKGEDIPMLEDFMAENPNIKVVNQSLEGADYANLLNTMMLSGTIPDVFLVQPWFIPDLVKNGFIQPVGGIPGVDKQAANGPINDMLSVNGDVYAYALNGGKGTVFVYYNTLYFDENGLSPVTTLDEFEKLMGDIAAIGGVPLIVSAGDTWSADYAGYNIYQDLGFEMAIAGGNYSLELALLRGEKKVSDVRGPQFRKLSEWYANGWVSPDALSMGWEQAAQFLVDGGAVLFPMGNWVPGSTPVQESDPETFKIGAFPLPYATLSDGNRHVISSVDRAAVLSAQSAHPEAAQKLYEYIIRDDVLVNYLERQGLIGINVDAKVDPVFEFSFDDFAKPDIVLEAVSAVMPAGFTELFWQHAADIFTGANVEELLANMDAEFEAFMANVDADEYISANEAKR